MWKIFWCNSECRGIKGGTPWSLFEIRSRDSETLTVWQQQCSPQITDLCRVTKFQSGMVFTGENVRACLHTQLQPATRGRVHVGWGGKWKPSYVGILQNSASSKCEGRQRSPQQLGASTDIFLMWVSSTKTIFFEQNTVWKNKINFFLIHVDI